MNPLLALLVFAWIAIWVLTFAFGGLLRRVSVLEQLVGMSPPLRVGPEAGSVLPLDISSEYAGAVSIFAEDTCSSCRQLVPLLPRLVEESGTRSVNVVYRNARDQDVGESSSIRILDQRHKVFDRLAIHSTPFAIAVDRAGVVLATSPVGSEQLLAEFLDNVKFEAADESLGAT